MTPGDLLHGDQSGLVSVPREIVDTIAKRAKAVRAEEADYFAFLESDRFTLEELKRRINPRGNN